MEIKCQHCEHIGAPSSINPTAQGFSLICAKCGVVNVVENSEKAAPPVFSAGETASQSVPGKNEKRDTDRFSADANFEKLIPEQGIGYRCPKCLSILSSDETPPTYNCRVCGLDLMKDYENMEELPWERPPSGKDALFEQGILLWRSLEESPSSLHFEKFVEFTNVSGFHDLQIRKLRQFLVSFPEDENARKYLRIQSEKIQTRIIVAQSQSQSQTQYLGSKVQQARQKLLIFVAIALVILIIFFANFIYA